MPSFKVSTPLSLRMDRQDRARHTPLERLIFVSYLLHVFFQLFCNIVGGLNWVYGSTKSRKHAVVTVQIVFIGSFRDEEQGIIPRAVADVFKLLDENDLNDFSVRVSYLEVYKEEFKDLLEVETASKDIHIREDKGNIGT